MEKGKNIVPDVHFGNFNKPSKIPSSNVNNPPKELSSLLVDVLIKKTPIATKIGKSSIVIAPSPKDGNRINIQTDNGKKFTIGCNMNSNVDEKKLRRSICNRISSENCRLRIKQQCHDLNMTVKRLEEEIMVNQALIETKTQKISQLRLVNSMLMTQNSMLMTQLEEANVRARELETEVTYYRDMSQMQAMPVIESSSNGHKTLEEMEAFLLAD